MAKQRAVVFANGTATGGGSGFRNLVESTRVGVLRECCEVVGVVCGWPGGGVKRVADELGVYFHHLPKAQDAHAYRTLRDSFGADWVLLSGWLRKVEGLDPRRTLNIHPGPLPQYGGLGMYGDRIHERVLKDYQLGRIDRTEVTMHFVTDEVDGGPVIFRYPVALRHDDTVETLSKRVQAVEYGWQPYVTSLVLRGHISWDGRNPDSLVVPQWYPRVFSTP